MKLKALNIFVIVFTIGISTSFGQSSKQQYKQVHFRENVKTALSVKERAMLEEVYADKLNEYVLSKPNRLKGIKHLLRNRIEITEIPKLLNHPSKYILLSEAGLFNSYNKALVFDSSFDPNTFNVLKYNLQFYGKGSKIYRIDNTKYFIIIKSQHQ